MLGHKIHSSTEGSPLRVYTALTFNDGNVAKNNERRSGSSALAVAKTLKKAGLLKLDDIKEIFYKNLM